MNPSNDYDAYAKARAEEFASGKNLVHAYIEKPAMYALLPELEGKEVLCIGCGTGEECAELHARGGTIAGFDISAASIRYAEEHVSGVSFKTLDMDSSAELLALGQNQFDFIYSSLTFHYSNDLRELLKSLHELLKPGGTLLFSVGHPLRWAGEFEQEGNTKSVVLGYRQSKDTVEVFGDYLATKQFTQKLFDGPEITYWMRPISAYFSLLKETGFVVKEFQEPVPVKAAQKVDKIFWELRTKMPVDMIFLAQKS